MSERRCGTCRLWVRCPLAHIIGDCEELRRQTAEADGTTCPTWQPADAKGGERG